MSVLFVVSRLQDSLTIFKMAERSAHSGVMVMILFTEGGCHHAIDRELVASLSYAEGLFCLKPDSQGLMEKIDGSVKLIDYVGWMELVEACDRIVSWA
jgi:sulfur transfer complex TusBCD TusB component (DsrH family)